MNSPSELLLDCVDPTREETMQLEKSTFIVSECRAFVELRADKKRFALQ